MQPRRRRALGQSIRLVRIERKLTIEELGERAGLSRDFVQRIERGDMGCAIVAAFQAAAIVGIRLYRRRSIHNDGENYRQICFQCVGDAFLSREIETQGAVVRCD